MFREILLNCRFLNVVHMTRLLKERISVEKAIEILQLLYSNLKHLTTDSKKFHSSKKKIMTQSNTMKSLEGTIIWIRMLIDSHFIEILPLLQSTQKSSLNHDINPMALFLKLKKAVEKLIQQETNLALLKGNMEVFIAPFVKYHGQSECFRQIPLPFTQNNMESSSVAVIMKTDTANGSIQLRKNDNEIFTPVEYRRDTLKM